MNLLSKVAFKLTHVVSHLNVRALLPRIGLILKKVVLPHVALVTLDFAVKKLSANRELGRRVVSKAKVLLTTLAPILREFLKFTLNNHPTTR